MKARNLKLFYWHETLFSVSESMLGFVLVLFVYKLFNSISAVFFFNLAWNVIQGFTFIPIFNLGTHFKRPKYLMAFGMVFYVLALTLFAFTGPEAMERFYLGTLFFALYVSTYWLTKHWFFSLNSDYQKIGSQVSNLAVIRIGITFLSPIIAGYLSFFISEGAALFMGAMAGLVSIVPVLMFHAPPHDVKYKRANILEVLKKPELKAIRGAHFFEGISHSMHSVGWILAFSIFIGNIKDFGYLMGISTLIAAILTKMAGRWFDGRKRTKLLKRIVTIDSLGLMSYGTIFFFSNLAYVYVVSTVNNFIATMQETVANSFLYAYSNKVHPLNFHLNREIHLVIGRVLVNLTMGIAFLYLPKEALWLLIVAGGMAAYGFILLGKSDHLLH